MLRSACRCGAALLLWTAAAASAAGLTDNRFNPALSLIVQGRAAHFERDPSGYLIAGFPLADDTGPGLEGLSLGETELTASASVDPYFFGSVTMALTPEGTVETEEAYVETTAVGGGWTLRGGRFLSGLGYLNAHHSHRWDFADPPLAYAALLGGALADDGIQARWLAPLDLFLELGAEWLRGEAFPAGGAARSGRGTATLFIHAGGDVGRDHSWRAGLSVVDARAGPRLTGDPPDTFDGRSRLWMADLIWKWAPFRDPTERNFKLQLEWFRRRESGQFNGQPYTGRQHGGYLQGVYQFRPRWRVGVRHDVLRADAPGGALAGTAVDPMGHRPRRNSVMLDFSPSEFSRLRLQFNDDRAGPQRDRQWYFQYVMSLGAHGAHSF